MAQPKQSHNLLAHFAIIGAACAWGIVWYPMRYFEDLGVHPIAGFGLFNVAALMLLLILAYHRVHIHQIFNLQVTLLGNLFAIGFLCYSISFVYTEVARSILLFYLTPIWSSILGYWILKERFAFNRVLAVISGLSGIIILTDISNSGFTGINIGDFLGFISGWFWAFGAVYTRKYDRLNVFAINISTSAFSCIIAIIALMLLPDITLPGMDSNWTAIMLNSIVIGVFLIAPSALIIVWAQQKISPGRAGILMMGELIIAIISAHWLANEYLTFKALIGGLLIAGATVLEIIPFGPKKSTN